MPGVAVSRINAALAAAFLFGFLSVPADAQIRVDLPPQPLAQALTSLGSLANLNIYFDPSLVDGHQAPALKADLSADQALERLLAGTRLHAVRVDENTVRVVPDSAEKHAQGARNPATGDVHIPGSVHLASAADVQALAARVDEGSDTSSETSASPRTRPLAEVVVTAEKRAERLQDVPVPVTAISADALTQNNQTRVQDYYATVPGLAIAPSVESRQRVSIRGITTGGTSNPTVGITVDGVSYGSSTEIGGSSVVPDIDPSDLARIEILRGPQGTLYGASSLGGLINFVTVDPSTAALSGRIEAGTSGVHNGDQLGYSVRGAVNAPLSDQVAVRASAFVREDPGYIDNPVLHIDGINKSVAQGGHFSALWQPGQDVSLKLSALAQQTRGNGSSDVDIQPGLGDLQQDYPVGVGAYERRVQAYSATFKAKLGNINLTAVTGYNINSNNASWDYTYALGKTIRATFGVPDAPVFEDNRTGKFSQEVRLDGALGSYLDWLVGAFYTDERSHYVEDILGEDAATGADAGTFASLIFPTTYKEYALFEDLTYHVTDRFDIQFGGRESRIKQNFAETVSGPYDPILLKVPSPVVYPVVGINDNAFTYLVTPKFTLSPDFMLYARLASGYRAGGGNAAAVGISSVPREYSPDKTQNYELGAKADILDHRLSFDTSVYYILWNHIQLPLRDPTSHLSYTGNGSQAKSQGVEFSVTARPLTGLSMTAWVAYDDAVLTQAFPTSSTVYGKVGNRLPNTSRFSGNFSLDQQFPLTQQLTGSVGATVSYLSDRLGVFAASPARQVLPGYAQTNVHAGMQYDSWAFDLYGNNIIDRRGLLDGGSDLYPPYAYVYIQPRTLGLTVSKTF